MPQKQGSSHPNIAPYGDVFKTSDGYEILLAVGNDRQFQDLCKALQLDDLKEDSRFMTNPDRVVNRKILSDRLAFRIAHLASDVLLKDLQTLQVPAGKIQNLEQVFELPEAKELIFKNAELKGLRNFVVNTSFLSDQPHFLPPPTYGEHTAEILSQTLEMSAFTLQDLTQRGIIA